jgi:ABC-type microcin C transport system permease subunit YejB
MLALALVPHSASFYDSLPVLLTARRKVEALLLSVTSTAGYLYVLASDKTGLGYHEIVDRGWPVLLLTLYLPALVILLKRARSSSVLPSASKVP